MMLRWKRATVTVWGLVYLIFCAALFFSPAAGSAAVTEEVSKGSREMEVSGTRGQDRSTVSALGRKYALLIAVERFNTRTPSRLKELPELKKDLDTLRDVLEASGYHVKILEISSPVRPTGSNIRVQIDELAKNTHHPDTFLVYFTGHSEGRWLCPWDYRPDLSPEATGLELADVSHLIKKSVASKKILILDTCYSGTAVDANLKAKAGPRSGLDLEALEKEKSAGFYILTSCQAGERSYIDESAQMSYFTKYLVDGLKGAADGYGGTKDCWVELSELYNYVHYEVDRAVRRDVRDQGGRPATQRAHLLVEGQPVVGLVKLAGDCEGEVLGEREEFRALMAEVREEREKLRKELETVRSLKEALQSLIASLREETVSKRGEERLRELEKRSQELDETERELLEREEEARRRLEDIESQSGAEYEKKVRPRSGDPWTEPLTGVEFVWITGGCFKMGQTEYERYHIIRKVGRQDYQRYYTDERPAHDVCVNGYWIGKHEVTKAQFRRFVRATGYRTDAEKEGYGMIWRGKWEKGEGYHWQRPGFEQDERHPVVHVSWNDANAMARWLSRRYSLGFRLPTEAEWEYACRARTATFRYWGNNADDACEYANVHDLLSKKQNGFDWFHHDCYDGYVYTAPVGSFIPNKFGLYDMLGNVWEWCGDRYEKWFYRRAEARSANPVCADRGPCLRVLRGASWSSDPGYARAAFRYKARQDNRLDDVGFRLVCVPSN